MKTVSKTAAIAAAALAATLAAGPAATATATADTGATPITVTVHADRALARVPDAPIGSNDWDSDPNITNPGTGPLLNAAGLRVRELNTGPFDDVYRWRTNTDDANPLTAALGPDNPVPWQTWARETEQTHAQAMIHVNYGSTATDGPGGTDIGPQEAAAWVRQANVVDHDGIKYWTIGEEVWGNGFYTSFPAFEPDNHADKSPTAYGQNAVLFAKAMKAVDPSIKVGVEISPFAPTAGQPDWNGPLLKAAGSAIDFVDVHWYRRPFADTSDASLFKVPAQIPTEMASIKAGIAQNAGAHADHIQVIVGETNTAGFDPGIQSVTAPDALYAADDVATWLEQGASQVDWFNTHIGAVQDSAGSPDDPDGHGYGDWGLLSSGVNSCVTNAQDAKVCEPPVNTPFPAYYALSLTSRLASPGAALVQTSVSGTGNTGNAPIVTHAAVQHNGNLVVLIENEDPAATHTVQLNYPGYRPLPLAITYRYAPGSTGIATSLGLSGSAQLPPYSLTELVLSRS
ncbi:hypothetical protein ABH935_000291 [Catenulispora sp. GAS73]|uniref:hypothetical protein n=1 Tax=Catenulispora sp. GAS73 TaxID=3156269 RepID=UPI00351174C8